MINRTGASRGAPAEFAERYYIASQWQLMWRKFKRHRLAMIGLTVLLILYVTATFCEFVAPFRADHIDTEFIYCPPQKVHILDSEGRLRLPFVYDLERTFDRASMTRVYLEITTSVHSLRLFVSGDRYKLLGLIESDIHLFGARDPDAPFHLLGTDDLGRDMLSRILYGARVSLSIGLIGVFASFLLGSLLGGISGFYGGRIDMFIQRAIDFLISIPTIPLWMGLSAALPIEWPPLRVYFFITIILSIVGWARLARVVRGRLISLREEDYVLAARIAGASDGHIITRHLLPGFLSYLIVSLTLSVPYMILGETALSFLGLGLRPPVVSWGVLLKAAQTSQTVILYPWMMIPGLFVIVAVLAFNVLGDGLRDAADPYK